MPGLGTIMNCVCIVVGSIMGVVLKRGLPQKWQETMMNGIALCIVIIGIQMAMKTNNIIITICSLVIGAIIGEVVDIEKIAVVSHKNLRKIKIIYSVVMVKSVYSLPSRKIPKLMILGIVAGYRITSVLFIIFYLRFNFLDDILQVDCLKSHVCHTAFIKDTNGFLVYHRQARVAPT